MPSLTPWFRALGLMLVAPWRAADRLRSMGLPAAMAAYLLALFLVDAVILIFSEVFPQVSDLTLTAVWSGGILLPLATGDLPTDSLELTQFAVWLLLMILVLPVLWAYSLMPWLAGDEPVKTSYARALRVALWSAATFLGLAIVDLLVGAILVDAVRGGIVALVEVSLLLAFMVATLALAQRARPAPCCRWPAQCEGCSYTLMGQATDQACPECGLEYAKTLGADIRRGTPWDRRTSLGAWFVTTWDAVLHPRRTGQLMAVYPQ